jgi:hypothetical protein
LCSDVSGADSTPVFKWLLVILLTDLLLVCFLVVSILAKKQRGSRFDLKHHHFFYKNQCRDNQSPEGGNRANSWNIVQTYIWGLSQTINNIYHIRQKAFMVTKSDKILSGGQPCQLEAEDHSLMMETEEVSETLDFGSKLTGLITLDNFITLSNIILVRGNSRIPLHL